jgi:hypothetical protein
MFVKLLKKPKHDAIPKGIRSGRVQVWVWERRETERERGADRFRVMGWANIPTDDLVGSSQRPKSRGVALQVDPEPNARVLRALGPYKWHQVSRPEPLHAAAAAHLGLPPPFERSRCVSESSSVPSTICVV